MNRKTFRKILAGALFLISAAALNAMDGEEIMRLADERYTGDSSRQKTSMELINKRGNIRERSLISYWKDYGDTEKQVMVFQKPGDVEGVGYMAYSYDEKDRDDDTWLFLPALKKSRRISGSSRNDDFMGTDFTYDDMGDRKVEEDSHRLIGEETVDGHLCWVVESVPREEGYMYSRRVSRIRQDIHMVIMVEYYDRRGGLMKTFSIPRLEEIDGIWTAREMVMENIQKKHKTVLRFDDIVYNEPVEDSFFSVATLERGRIR